MPVLENPAREYRARARHCVEIADSLEGVRKVVLLEMAQAWMRLADQAWRNKKTDLVYETAPRKPGPVPSPQRKRPQPQPE